MLRNGNNNRVVLCILNEINRVILIQWLKNEIDFIYILNVGEYIIN